MQGEVVRIEVPVEAYKEFRRNMTDEERQELKRVRGVGHSPEAEKLLCEAIVPYLAQSCDDVDPERADYTLGGELVESGSEQERDSEGNFT